MKPWFAVKGPLRRFVYWTAPGRSGGGRDDDLVFGCAESGPSQDQGCELGPADGLDHSRPGVFVAEE